jgi:hypothetical protein
MKAHKTWRVYGGTRYREDTLHWSPVSKDGLVTCPVCGRETNLRHSQGCVHLVPTATTDAALFYDFKFPSR